MFRTMALAAVEFMIFVGIGCQQSRAESSLPAESFVENFNGPDLDRDKWLIGHKNWGGKDQSGNDYNGGVIPENISIRDGMLILTALGDLYDGSLRGINRDGSRRPDGRRVGAMIATREYLGPGRFEVRLKVAPRIGVASAVWTFHYLEKGNLISNQEIDIEFPGRASEAPIDPTFDRMLATTWIGEAKGEFTTRYVKLPAAVDDGKFHVVGFEWHIGSEIASPRVDFFVDHKIVSTIRSTVPSVRARFYVGTWFPKRWAGEPHFRETQMVVDWIRYQPFKGESAHFIPESFPDSGWQ